MSQIAKEDLSDLLVDRNGEMSLAKLYRWLTTVEDRVSMSLPAHLKRAIVESRTYITREAAMEECINDLLYCINVTYAGWCMTALSMNQMVNGAKVRDVLNTVATEDASELYVFNDKAMAGLDDFSARKTPFNINSPRMTDGGDRKSVV